MVTGKALLSAFFVTFKIIKEDTLLQLISIQ